MEEVGRCGGESEAPTPVARQENRACSFTGEQEPFSEELNKSTVDPLPPPPHLDAEQQGVVGVLQPPLPVLHLSDSLLVFLQLADIIDRRLQDGSFVPPRIPDQPITGPEA